MTTIDQSLKRPASSIERDQIKDQCSAYARRLSTLQPAITISNNETDRQEALNQVSAIGSEIETNVGSDNFRNYLREQAKQIEKDRLDNIQTAKRVQTNIDELANSKNQKDTSRVEEKKHELDKFVADSNQRYLTGVVQNSFVQGIAATLR